MQTGIMHSLQKEIEFIQCQSKTPNDWTSNVNSEERDLHYGF